MSADKAHRFSQGAKLDREGTRVRSGRTVHGDETTVGDHDDGGLGAGYHRVCRRKPPRLDFGGYGVLMVSAGPRILNPDRALPRSCLALVRGLGPIFAWPRRPPKAPWVADTTDPDEVPSTRQQREAQLKLDISRVGAANHGVYGAR